MDVTAVSKYVKLSPSKARPVVDRIRGLPASKALQVTAMSDRKAAAVVDKTLKSAIANAENNAKLAVDDLVVKDAVIDGGPTFGRYWPRARGMVRRITRRTCHVRIVLTDGKEE